MSAAPNPTSDHAYVYVCMLLAHAMHSGCWLAATFALAVPGLPDAVVVVVAPAGLFPLLLCFCVRVYYVFASLPAVARRGLPSVLASLSRLGATGRPTWQHFSDV